MNWIALQFDRISAFVDDAVAGGYVLALGLICILQYLLHLYKLSVASRAAKHYQDEMHALQDDFRSVQRDRTLSRLENSILREFVSQTEIRTALELMMRRFIPDPNEGFSAFLKCDPQGDAACEVYQSRGLSAESCGGLRLDDNLKKRIIRDRVVVLEGAELKATTLYQSIAASDRRKIRRLNLAALGDADELVGILVSTALYPPGAALEQQIELTRRLMLSVSTDFKRSQALEQQSHKLRATNEMLALRSIADIQFDSPLAMIQEFVNQWMKKVDASRAVLYLKKQDETNVGKSLLRCGIEFDSGVEQSWRLLEDQLAERHMTDCELSTYDADELSELRLERSAAGAVVAPLVQSGQPIGVVCLTRHEEGAFEAAQISLAVWAAEYLGDMILRVLNQAMVEKHAREDSLTELANRRSFDLQIKQEIKLAHDKQQEVSLLLFDLDHFKNINDTYGHQAGDFVLRRTAQMLKDEAISSVRAGDRILVARYGGEEMAVLLPNVNLVGAHRIGESIRRAIESEEFEYGDEVMRLTISVGIATCPEHADNVKGLIAAADTALYEAKESGRNQVLTAEALPQEQPV